MDICIEGVQRIVLHTARGGAAAFINRYRDVETFENYCKVCPIYGTTWACPPFDAASQLDLSPYQSVTLLGFQSFIITDYQQPVGTPEALQARSEGVMRGVRLHLDPLLLSLESSTPATRIFLPGSCRLCDGVGCTRAEHKACRYPERMRSSLEAVGFNVVLAAEELLRLPLCWPEDLRMPPFLTLLAALFHVAPCQSADLSALNRFIKRVAH